ncbi:MAG: diaminopropionate ammonia-lyase [Elusimicrobiota bacterium]|nr:diaminopropionate ammonia-lyase [Elusimicrobiota bacterium]
MKIKSIANKKTNFAAQDVGGDSYLQNFSLVKARKVLDFHKSFKQYERTPLINLQGFAKRIGVKGVFVKDESKRFGLNAFKVLGGSYAIGSLMAKRLNMALESLSFEKLQSDEIQKKLGDLLFVSATDGNHGRGIAWTAMQLKQKAVIFMPKGSAQSRVDNILKTGAQCIVTDVDYDNTVVLANRFAKEKGGITVQDTAWQGYEEIPLLIMQGYMTLAYEILEQLRDIFDCDVKDIFEKNKFHLFVQAGVGSFPASILAFYKSVLGAHCPNTAIVEPHQAACIYESIKAADAKAHKSSGDLNTIMAGLACGMPSLIAWRIIRDFADFAISCSDSISEDGMRILGKPIDKDESIISGESGAVGAGLINYLMTNPNGAPFAEQLKVDKNSYILLISTEGDTFPQKYMEILNKEEYNGN